MRRRGLVSLVGALVVAAPSCVAAGPELDPAHLRLVPLDKGLDPAWVRRLAARGGNRCLAARTPGTRWLSVAVDPVFGPIFKTAFCLFGRLTEGATFGFHGSAPVSG